MKILDCSVAGGVATITDSNGAEIAVPDAVLQCAGVFKSKGKLIVSDSGAVYIVDTQPDLQFLLNEVKAIAEQVGKMSLIPVSRTPDQSPLAPDVTVAIEVIKAKLDAKELI